MINVVFLLVTINYDANTLPCEGNYFTPKQPFSPASRFPDGMNILPSILIVTLFCLAATIPDTTLAQSRDLATPEHSRSGKVAEAEALISLAQEQSALGQQLKVIDSLTRALQLLDQGTQVELIAVALTGLGHAYTQTGNYTAANKALSRGITLQDRLPPDTTAALLSSRATLNLVQGDTAAALADNDQAAELARTTGNTPLLASILANSVRATANAGVANDKRYTAALEITDKLPATSLKASLYINLGQSAGMLADSRSPWLERANAALLAAEQTADACGDQRALSYALGYRGRLYAEHGRIEEALTLTNRAVYAAQASNAPESLYQWQWQNGRLLRAQQQTDAAITAYRNAVVTLQGVRSDISIAQPGTHSTFRETAAPIYFELADLLLSRARSQQTPEATRQDLLEARDQVENLKAAELQDYFQDDCVTDLQNRTVRLEEIASHTAILYPIMLEDRLELLLTLPDGLQQVTIDIPAASIIAETRHFRQLLEKRTTRQYLRPAQQLYEWLVNPIRKELQRQQVETLIVVPDGALRTIPLGALYDADSKQYLIEQYAVAYTPGLFLTDARALPRENLQVLLNGLTVGIDDFPPLPNVASELEQIHSLYEDSTILQDEDFIVSNVEGALQKTPYSIVHIASHGQFSSDRNETFLLAYNEKLSIDRLEDLMGLSQYRQQPVELLALSACQTAAGDDRAALGLAGIAVKAGARSALASLWFVSDEATTELIADFYRELANPQISKARALQHAQVKLLQDRRYRHAGYWAPYLLIGNWL